MGYARKTSLMLLSMSACVTLTSAFSSVPQKQNMVLTMSTATTTSTQLYMSEPSTTTETTTTTVAATAGETVAAIAATATTATTATTAATATKSTTTATPTKKVIVPNPTVPCFGAAPFIKRDIFFGENVWNKLTSEYGTENTGTFLRAAELKHGRSAMLATIGFAFQKLGISFDDFSPHEYLSVPLGIKFADLELMGPFKAAAAVPPNGWGQVFGAIAAIELYELTHNEGAIATEVTVAPGLTPGGLTGDLGWNPLKIKIDDRRRLVELQNGRAAMFAITAWISEEAIPGSVPLPLPW